MSPANTQTDEAQQIAQFSGTAQAGNTAQHSFPVDQVGSLTLILVNDQPGLTLSLLDPSGANVATEISSAEPVDDALALEGAYYASIKIQDPPPGEWIASLTSPQSSPYTLLVQGTTTTRLNVQTKSYRQNVGEAAILHATLTQERAVLHPSIVQMELYQEARLIGTFSFHDDGAAPDEKAHDGIYSLEISDQGLIGTLFGTVTAKEGHVQRQALVSLLFVQPTAKILNIEGERLIDENSDGLAEYLEITVRLDVEQTGQYILNAYLDDKDGQAIAFDQINHAFNAVLGGETQLEEGAQSLSLSFPGPQIRSHNINGPYHLRLILQDQSQEGVDVDVTTEAYVTKPYQVSDFSP